MREVNGQVFSADSLEVEVGFVLVKPNGAHKIFYGVHTDIDVIDAVKGFLGKDI